jgi:hypothetical protein
MLSPGSCDNATPGDTVLFWHVSGQYLTAHSAQGQLFYFHTKLFENEICILPLN